MSGTSIAPSSHNAAPGKPRDRARRIRQAVSFRRLLLATAVSFTVVKFYLHKQAGIDNRPHHSVLLLLFHPKHIAWLITMLVLTVQPARHCRSFNLYYTKVAGLLRLYSRKPWRVTWGGNCMPFYLPRGKGQ